MTNHNEYHFITHWRMEGTCDEISDVLDQIFNGCIRWQVQSTSASGGRYPPGCGRYALPHSSLMTTHSPSVKLP